MIGPTRVSPEGERCKKRPPRKQSIVTLGSGPNNGLRPKAFPAGCHSSPATLRIAESDVTWTSKAFCSVSPTGPMFPRPSTLAPPASPTGARCWRETSASASSPALPVTSRSIGVHGSRPSRSRRRSPHRDGRRLRSPPHHWHVLSGLGLRRPASVVHRNGRASSSWTDGGHGLTALQFNRGVQRNRYACR